MKILILSNWSEKIAAINELTEPNKKAYADKHGYRFENVEMEYSDKNQIRFLIELAKKLEYCDIVLTMGCDAIFTNDTVKIEERIAYKERLPFHPAGTLTNFEPAITMAKDLTCCFPICINNDVMIWPRGEKSSQVIVRLVDDAELWLTYPQLWQNHIWNMIQSDFKQHVELVAPRQMNATFQPMTRRIVDKGDGTQESRLTRIPGESSWQLGDWIFHALDMPIPDKIQVLKWALQFAGDGTWKPNQDARGEHIQL